MAIKLDHLALLPARLDKILRYNNLSTNLLLRPIQVAYDSVWKLYLLNGLHYLINSWPRILHDHIFFDNNFFVVPPECLHCVMNSCFRTSAWQRFFFFFPARVMFMHCIVNVCLTPPSRELISHMFWPGKATPSLIACAWCSLCQVSVHFADISFEQHQHDIEHAMGLLWSASI